MRQQPTLPSRSLLALLALLLSLATGNAAADSAAGVSSAQANLRVTVVVPRYATMRVATPRSIVVSEADVERGYVELAAPVEVMVQSNVVEGYTLAFDRAGEHVQRAHVQGIAGELVVGEGVALATRPAAGRGMWRDVLQLHFRFDLAPATRAGQHPWPLEISMMSS